ncbi:chemotaxis protein CheA [Bacillus sp. FJAT-47783]|uniref:chemotaxis protein CheA n=1 Tax=Bacillus sp. FJAT-47783 TaxID=2922712 RepID=UPI001FABE383|nr:chemotaxis protein CheA [Bacillus sp. FJAT-47783]
MEMNQYLEIFLEESNEHLQACNDKLLELEQNPEDLLIINEIFRSAHTLKGMSATMGYEDLANLTHKMENVLDALRNETLSVTPEIVDVLFLALESLEEMVDIIAAGGDGKKDVSEIVNTLEMIEKGERDQENPSTINEQTIDQAFDEYERTIIQQSIEQGYRVYEVIVTLREDCLLKAARAFMVFELLEKDGEILKSNPSVEMLEEENFQHQFNIVYITKEEIDDVSMKILKVSEIDNVNVQPIHIEDSEVSEMETAQKYIAPAKEVAAAKENEKVTNQQKQCVNEKKMAKPTKSTTKTIRVNIDRLDVLMNLFEELVIDKGRLEQISKDLNHPELKETVEKMSRVSSDLQNIILNMRMIPIETVFNRFPKMVRQLARDLNKKVQLQIIGAETELDRTVIDEIGDPLVHLIRNALDHGIETPEIRVKNGKNEEGTLTLRAYHSGNHVFIEIQDDGAGINQKKVLQKAIEREVISTEMAESLSKEEAYQLILSSGFSTADQISDISGRGVGLDVVKNTIESLGGRISIESSEGMGTLFLIQLPLTLSIISVMLVEVGAEKYGIPISSIIESLVINEKAILHTHNYKVIDYRGNIVPLVFLRELFDVREEHDADHFSVVIVKKGEKMAGIVVDSFIGQQEIVLKSLGQYLSNVFAISGATILGDGQVALIIDCNALIK